MPTWRWSLPSAFITKIWRSVQELATLSKTILLPSGDQSGWSSIAGLCVRLTACLPLVPITQISAFPAPPVASRFERKTIRLPSGENDGLRSDAFQFFVRRRMCVPSARMM